MDAERQRRVAENESLFREVNESVERLATGFVGGGEQMQDFLCECGDDACLDRVALRLREYEAVRADPRRFALVPGHEQLEVERVVEDHGRYVVVEKIGTGAKVAEELDPRA